MRRSLQGQRFTRGYVARGQLVFRGRDYRPGFTTYLAVMNPNSTEATCVFDYMLADGTVASKVHKVTAQSRFTIDVSLDVGADKDVSTHITSSIPVVAERPMYFTYNGWSGGHDSLGATSSAKTWYFSEGRPVPVLSRTSRS